MVKRLLSFILIALLTSCASLPEFDMTHVERSLTPEQVVSESTMHKGKIVLWGGTILDTRNLKEITQIEVLAHPLDSDNLPIQKSKALGRFIIQYAGFLEPATYAQGRELTVLGTIVETKKAKIGDSTYTYPVVSSKQLELWAPYDQRSNTSFHFGIGIRL